MLLNKTDGCFNEQLNKIDGCFQHFAYFKKIPCNSTTFRQ